MDKVGIIFILTDTNSIQKNIPGSDRQTRVDQVQWKEPKRMQMFPIIFTRRLFQCYGGKYYRKSCDRWNIFLHRYTHLSLCYAFGNEFLTILDLVHKSQNQTYFILLELHLSWLLPQNTLSGISTAHSSKVTCQKKNSNAQLKKLRHSDCMRYEKEGVERTPCWTGTSIRPFLPFFTI